MQLHIRMTTHFSTVHTEGMGCQAVFVAVCLVMSTMSEVSSGSINIARGKDASQSTTSDGGTANRATDGITNGRFSDGSCTSTKFTNNPWFVLDLDETYQIQNVVIFSRTDECCVSRLSNFSVEVFGGGNCNGGPGHGSRQCAYHENVADRVTNVSCNGFGRFIRIKIHQTSTLHLCEVEVYTDESTNIALRKPTEQSSTRMLGYVALSSDIAVDGLSVSCSVTKYEEDPWWSLQLLHDYQIARVVIISVLSGAHLVVSVDEDVCSDYDGVVRPSVTLTCGIVLTGSEIRIRSIGWTPLVLCEVEVYGVPTDPCEVEEPVRPNRRVIREDFSTLTALAIPSTTSRSNDADSTDSPLMMTSTDKAVSTTDDQFSNIILTSASGYPIPSSHVSVYEGTVTTSVATTSSTVPPSSSVKTYTSVATRSSINGARTVSEQCLCRCKTPHPETLEELQDSMDELQANLTLDVANTSSYRRKRTSAKDPRSSALYLGTLGIVMYIIVFAFLFLSDVIIFWKRGPPQNHAKSTTVDPRI